MEVTTYRSSKLKNRLKRCFGERLSFRRVTTGEVVETVFKSSVDEDQISDSDIETDVTREQEDESRQVFRMAKMI